MDDYNLDSLNESRNEWTCRFLDILTPLLHEGVISIFNEAYSLCKQNDEEGKYLMTFQNLLSRVPSWNQTIIETECKRIIENSQCKYLNDLLTCIHIIQLKVLTNVRVCKNQKQVDIDIPNLESYIHKVYINIERKLYKNIFLFEKDCTPLQKQKNNRECETIIKECILTTVRENIPIDKILRAYMSEKMEEEVDEETIKKPEAPPSSDISGNTSETTISKEEDKPASAPQPPALAAPKPPEIQKDELPITNIVESVPEVSTPVVNDLTEITSEPENIPPAVPQKETVIDFTTPTSIPKAVTELEPVNDLVPIEPVEKTVSFGDELGLESLEMDSLDLDNAPAISLNE